MSPDARGRLFAAIALGGFALSAWMLLLRRPAPPSPRNPIPILVASSKALLPADCGGLRAEYRSAWARVATCQRDADCVAEHRAELWSDLDGCARFGRLQGPDPEETARARARADAVAQAWLERGCAHTYELCEAAPLARCLRGVCAERPPARVPPDWTPVRIPGLVSFWLPSTLEARELPAEDSLARLWEGEGRRLSLTYGPWQKAAEPDDPFRKVVGEMKVTMFGEPTTLRIYQRTPLATGSTTRLPFEATAGREDLRTDHLSLLLLQGENGGTLRFHMDCDGRSGCDELATIVESARLLTYVLERDP